MFKDILIFLGLDYRDASLITLYFVGPGISIPKIRSIGLLHHIKKYARSVPNYKKVFNKKLRSIDG